MIILIHTLMTILIYTLMTMLKYTLMKMLISTIMIMLIYPYNRIFPGASKPLNRFEILP